MICHALLDVHDLKSSKANNRKQNHKPILAGPGVAEKKDLGKEYRDHVLKYASMMKNPLFNLERAASYLENWVNGTVAPSPVLDVSGFLGQSRLGAVSGSCHFSDSIMFACSASQKHMPRDLRVCVFSGPLEASPRLLGGGHPDSFAVAPNPLG